MGDLGAQRRDQDPGRHRRRPGLHRGQGAVHRPRPTGPRRPGRRQTAALLRGAAKSLDSGQQVEDRLEVVLADDVRGGDGPATDRASWSPPPRTTRSTSTAGRRCSPPGTSSSPDPRVRSTTRRPRPGSPAPSTPRTSGSRRRRPWASTWSTCRRSTRSAASSARGPNNTLTPGPGDPGSPWAIGGRGGRPRRHPSRPGRLRRVRPVRGQGQVARPGGRDGLRPAGRPGPSVGDRAPGVVLQAGRRFASRTRRTRRRSTRTSTRSTSTTTGTASTPSACAS